MVNLLREEADKTYVSRYDYQTHGKREMNLLNNKTLCNGVPSIGLEKMIIPSILLHLAIIALIIASSTLYIKRTSCPQIYIVSLVSSPSEKPLGLGKKQINREAGKIEPINPIKNFPKMVKIENERIAVPEPEAKPEPKPQNKSKPEFGSEPEPKLSIVGSLSEPDERIKTGYPGFPEQGVRELSDRKGDALYGIKEEFGGEQGVKEGINRGGMPISYSLSSRKPVLRSTAPSFIANPKPQYPMIAIRRKMEGVVLLKVEVLGDGGVGKIEVKRSSGYKALDESALEAVKNWKFLPATLNGISVKVWASIPIRFELER
ncbi:MAG: energy transducer TonB [Thermodesulfobacteriota bacterium]